MNDQENNRPDTDEIGSTLESGGEVNEAIEQEDDATAGISRAPGAAKYEREQAETEGATDNEELTGAP
jgi:hypothetical protein